MKTHRVYDAPGSVERMPIFSGQVWPFPEARPQPQFEVVRGPSDSEAGSLARKALELSKSLDEVIRDLDELSSDNDRLYYMFYAVLFLRMCRKDGIVRAKAIAMLDKEMEVQQNEIR